MPSKTTKIQKPPIIQREHKVSDVHEISVDWNGKNFLVIYGHHINGWFCAIPNWNKCFELAHPTYSCFNAEKIEVGFDDFATGKAIATAIMEHFQQTRE